MVKVEVQKILDLREGLQVLIIFYQNEKMAGEENILGAAGTELTAGEGGEKSIYLVSESSLLKVTVVKEMGTLKESF